MSYRGVDMTGRRIGMLTVIARLRRKQHSCGCVHLGSRTHGQTETSTYRIWVDMRRRCTDENRPQFKDYGGRGITVCDRWQSFENFFADMGHRPEGYSIERINNDGNYEPSNCCWLPLEKQSRNRRCVRRIPCGPEELPFSEAAHRSGLNPSTVHYRMNAGWPVERLLEPV